MNRIATFMIGFVLGGAVVGGAVYLSDTQDDSTSGPIEQPSVSGSLPAEDSPTPASSGTDDPDASPTPTVAVATRVTEADDSYRRAWIDDDRNACQRCGACDGDGGRYLVGLFPQCRYGQLVGGPHDLFLMFSREVLVRIDIGPGSAIETDTGMGVGDPISEVEDAYGDELERELHPYLGDRGSYLILDPEPEDGLLIIFETNRRSVTSFRSGFDQQVRYKEGCA